MAKAYQDRTDEELITELKSGNNDIMDYLMDKYKYLVRKKANALFLIGGDTDDLIQEGMIGLFKAVRDYEPGKESSFHHFAEICINRQMYTAIEASNRKKHSPLNTYVSLYSEDRDEENLIQKLISGNESNPEEVIIDHENTRDIKKALDGRLSPLEKDVLALTLQGLGYVKIAEKLDKTPKTIDNALQRIRRKLSVIV